MSAKTYLFVYTFGPVQSFIAQARKVVDFRNGSKFLAYLTDKILKSFWNRIRASDILEEGACQLVFPNESIRSKPNRFIAKLQCNTEDSADEEINALGNELVSTLSKTITSAFDSIRTKLVKYSQIVDINSEKLEEHKDQIKSFFEHYWVSIPFNESLSFKDNYRNLENWLGAIKNERLVNQIRETGEVGSKCDLCGQQNALYFYREEKAFRGEHSIIFDMYRRYIFNPREGFCAVCLLKRMLEEARVISKDNRNENKLPINSTSGACIGHLLRDNRLKNAFEKYVDLFKPDKRRNFFDEHYYFKENTSAEKIKKALSTTNIQFKAEMDEIIANLPKNVEEWFSGNQDVFENTLWSKYYALIMYDGDDMGKWISGSYLNDDAKLESFQINLSKMLGDYSETLRNAFDRHGGIVVYAGGDDNCGFVNIVNLFDLMNELKDNFPRFESILDKNSYSTNKKSTPSCGICIAHYKEPLSKVIEMARKMEHHAKQAQDKDSVSIAVIKHSGETLTSRFKWKYSEEGEINELRVLELLKDLTWALKDGIFSNTFINGYLSEFWWITEESKKEENVFSLIKEEFKRLLYRSVLMNRDKNGITREDLKNEEHEVNQKYLTPLIKLMESSKLEDFNHFLRSCDFLKSNYQSFKQIHEVR
ncbi:MAG: type III-B CRISPR-associated protein Cas10/Cmr2 [Candidatus Lokiarchaeota archaeon]|nr:type III-B CRISPR-associated protein Cas10/Cmr2 [Candidatus Lokiarchaeota archaeon]